MINTDMPKKVHEGRNVKRFREMLGIKQEALAAELGEDWTQSKISLLEAKETIEPAILDRVAKVLKVPVEAIKNFDEETAIVNIQNNYDGSTLNHSANYQYNYQPTFNPVDKVVELYERLLKEKDAEIEGLKKQVGEKKK
ncbi:helix-turn-helix transcriptional regulator [uncultured Chitinophaga sp.]|jgi:Helix-turn-helix.|uniref:helix-turn-helix domain-containing protein n=1 Tax=uncultured Chitinophaga sp. TaxID=339340 RepID=UPI0026025536|nr:helix-turn-helix transcriptional regulator [uncultured Chitinophaga sp.]